VEVPVEKSFYPEFAFDKEVNISATEIVDKS